MSHFFRIAVTSAAAFCASLSAVAEPGGDIDPARLKEMNSRILAAAVQIAEEYGTPPFTILISSEEEKKARLHRRLAELDRLDGAERAAAEMERRMDQAEQALSEKQATLMRLESELQRVKYDLTAAKREANVHDARSDVVREPATFDASIEVSPTPRLSAEVVSTPAGSSETESPADPGLIEALGLGGDIK